MSEFIQKSGFVLRLRMWRKTAAFFRKLWLSFLGMKIGKRTFLPHIFVTWPHQVSIGNSCKLESGVYFKYDGIWKKEQAIRIHDRVFVGRDCEFNIRHGLDIGDDSLIASGCRFIDHDHGIKIGQLMRSQPGNGSPITIGKNVWLGCNVVVLKGVNIGDGAVIAAGAVVTKSILSDEIWGGVPAKKIGSRTSST